MGKKSIDKVWRAFVRECSLDVDSTPLRKGSTIKRVKPLIDPSYGPAFPVQMLSKIDLFFGWANPSNTKLATQIVLKNGDISINELLEEMLRKMRENETCYPYIWWVGNRRPIKRVVYEDSKGDYFVKLDHKWLVALPLRALGALVGGNARASYEDVPKNGYLVVFENQKAAINYITSL